MSGRKNRKSRRRGQSQRRTSEQAAAYLDKLHRNDSSQSRQWNNEPPPGQRRPRRPPVAITEARDGTRLERVRTRKDFNQQLDGNMLVTVVQPDGQVSYAILTRKEPS